MSVIRFSADRSELFAPTPMGEIVADDYAKRRRVGKLAEFDRTSPLRLPRSHDVSHYVDYLFAKHASALTDDQPFVVMVHGFLFDPYKSTSVHPWKADNPHRRLYHFEDYDREHRLEHKAVPWPKDLHMADDDDGANGVAVGFGWHSSPGLASSLIKRFQNFYVRAYQYATDVSSVLARVLAALNEALERAGRKNRIDIYCHSLGSRVALRAMREVADVARAGETRTPDAQSLLRRMGRIVVLGGAEYVVEAQKAYASLRDCSEAAARANAQPQGPTGHFLPDGVGPEIYNVGSSENDVLDLLGENFGPRTFGNTNVIGHDGLGGNRRLNSRWRDVFLDHTATKQWLREKHDMRILGENEAFWAIWDHWFYYSAPENTELYRRIFRERDAFSLATLERQGMPQSSR